MNALPYVCQKDITVTHIIAPICHTHLETIQKGQLMESEDNLETSLGYGKVTFAITVSIP